ncbi:MAG TPA: hypothetical protein VFO06_09165 [Gemmatimonadales bacterium]|nr:hypothetical protein [Gemmatimonadales bacterium]
MTGRFRRIVGLDFVDLAIQAGVTMFLMIVADEAANNDAPVALVGAISFLILGVRRHFALRRLPPQSAGELGEERLAELEARLGEVSDLDFKVQELEERLDFAERLLAQHREPERLGKE